MIGRLFIDGQDAWTTYGVDIADGGLPELVSLPAFKTVTVNDWAEENGEEAELAGPVLPSRSVNIPFIVMDSGKFQSLLNTLTASVYHEFNTALIGRSFKLRLTQMPAFLDFERFSLATLRFADDFPPIVLPEGADGAGLDAAVRVLNGISYNGTPIPNPQDYTIDGTDLSAFGIYLLEGSDNAIRKAPDIKLALNRSGGHIPGTEYDKDAIVRYKAKDVTLLLFTHPRTVSDFWARWDALHALLLAPGERTVGYKGTTNKAYFKGSKVTEFNTDGNRAWVEFQLTLRYTDI